MMSRLWKWSLILGTCFLGGVLGILFWYSASKAVVIVEQAEQVGEADLTGLTEEILLQKEQYDFVVIVNAAHGGTNLGNAVNGIQEKDITLSVAQKLDELGEEEGIGIFLIRSSDIDISNENRVELIEAVGPDLVLDLHVNADPENERTLGTSVLYNGRFYHPGITNAALADLVERELVTSIEGKANGIFADEEERYPLLEMIRIPGVSVEMGYLTNEEEAALLKQDAYQMKMAQGLYRSIVRVREEVEENEAANYIRNGK